MKELEQIRQYLLTFPQWGSIQLTVDELEEKPGCAGLFPQGLEEVSRQVDAWGNAQVCNRLHFLLQVVLPPGQGAAWLLELQLWLQQQSTMGLAPKLGYIPDKERLHGYDGCLQRLSSPGVGVYRMRLYAQYISYQKGWFDDGAA